MMLKYWKLLAWLTLGIAIAQFCFWNSPASAKIPEHYTDLQFPPLEEVTFPDYQRYQLKNGLVVYLIEDHELPLITGNALIRGGSRLESPTQVGLGELTGIVWRSGGTQLHSPEEINLILEQKAATIESSVGTAGANLYFNALSADLESVLALFAEIMRYPAFDPEQLDQAKLQMRGGIARRNDNPGAIASREFAKLIYGDQSPYARTVEYQTLEPIQREDLLKFYQTYVRPDQVILGIVGDFDSRKIKSLIAENFADWRVETPSTIYPLPTATQNYTKGVFLVDQPQLTQSNILLGHLGGKFDDPDYPALTVVNGLLNGFGGRLFQEVRSRQGLAYSVYGLWTPRYDFPGLFILGGQTRSETTVPFIKSLLVEVEKLRDRPVTTAELDYAKNSILNSFVFEFEEASQTLSRLMSYEYYGYPKDFIFKYQQAIQATTIADVQRVAQKHLQPDNLLILVVGNKQAIQPSLADLNRDLKIVDISIPEPS
ncbi:pitrilysin family protein [Gloeocapsa sp. PCC 73106]|uniref:M16 family metallopeptidase n=1 Tax=Gloeocapsa sp. PCC 73106 TaxID=102232 RepID=UPI0002AC597F|nr:pitrilysin family protein [Gloeocapsa sp. PCC 73106]ELR97752.1 putative Zn-dependent peptidase [Gloeocapsa sp. PCC 73106]